MENMVSAAYSPFNEKLENHRVYRSVNTIETLRCFMEHHVYSVWDFMSLVKYLQSIVAPANYPWVAKNHPSLTRFINEIVLGEESDESNVAGSFSSHFELYQAAMCEIGADTMVSTEFVNVVTDCGVEAGLALPRIPEPSRVFTKQTFELIARDKPHQVAAALAVGREHIVPKMFRAILEMFGVTREEAPIFHFYLDRHIHLDEESHGPLSIRLMEHLCGGDRTKKQEATIAAKEAIESRIRLWDGVADATSKINGQIALAIG